MNNDSSNLKRDSIKVALNDFLIDLLGALVPGIIFLFSTIMSIVIPLIILYINWNNQNNSRPVSVEDLWVSNIFHGWFWLVLFFTFLILAYAIGNIFYRMDIKHVDKKGLRYVKKEHFKFSIYPVFKDVFGIYNYRKLRRYFLQKKRAKHNLSIQEFSLINESPESLQKELVKNYFTLLSDHFTKSDRTFLGKNIDKKESDNNENEKNVIHKLQEDTVSGIIALNIIAYKLYTEKNFKIFTANNIADIDPYLPVKEISDNPENLEEHIPHYQDFQNQQFKILIPFLKPYIRIPKTTNEAEDNYYILALGWYFLFSLRSEFACDREEDCQFPYVNYDKYLIKRNALHLLEYVEWNDPNSRSKNAMNKLKLQIQLNATQKDYNILVKNEAHIRMASSSWNVAGKNITISIVSCIIIVFVNIFHPSSSDIMEKFANILIILLMPISMFLLNLFIRKSVVKFIHYQRLREIFFVLQIYSELKRGNIIRPDNDYNLIP